MGNSEISLKPVKDLNGMNFYIPDYQRGYRWEGQQAIDLLEDLLAFAKRTSDDSEEIYCIQPLVVSESTEEGEILKKCKKILSDDKNSRETLENIKECIKGSWNVVDGQQRLTTIYLLLCCLKADVKYEIEYCTREKSKDFLSKIQKKEEENARENADFYHMYKVYLAIKEWLDNNKKEVNLIKSTLLNRVHFIWYQVEKSDEISVFTRLNIGKIPLTDAELIKALFLNRANFADERKMSKREIETLQHKIAVEWDEIERTLQNDEFWAFVHNLEYNKPTRIDFILDLIRQNDAFSLKKPTKGLKEEDKKKADEDNKDIEIKIGNDKHKTFRYFNEAFKKQQKDENLDWLKNLWQNVKKYYDTFNEWYYDYRLYHYIGYLTCVTNTYVNIKEYVSEWDQKTKEKEDFVIKLKNDIRTQLEKKDWISEFKTYKFDQDGKNEKRECVDILLLHNIETIIQQNDKLVSEAKYNLPNFSKFPFHLYKQENWQVEHIRPNAGDNLKNKKDKKLYLSLAKEYFKNDEEITKQIENFLQDKDDGTEFETILTKIHQVGGSLAEDDKNRIWNFVLLDESTNKEYGNQIFPVKRAFILNKENGKKIKYSFEKDKLKEEVVSEVAFVPPCTKNVFLKAYTPMPTTMINWNTEDAEEYQKDIEDKLKYYFASAQINKGRKNE